MRTQTKIRNKKILAHVFNLLFFIAVAYVMTLCYQKFQADNARAELNRFTSVSNAPELAPSILDDFIKLNGYMGNQKSAGGAV